MRVVLASAVVMLLIAGCTQTPAPTSEEIAASLTDERTGKIRAGRLGTATLAGLKVKSSRVEGSKATVLVSAKAEQSSLGDRYRLSAELRLHYQRTRKGWELRQTEEVKPWKDLTPKPRPSGSVTPTSDSTAIQQLQRARKAARLRVEAIPYGP